MKMVCKHGRGGQPPTLFTYTLLLVALTTEFGEFRRDIPGSISLYAFFAGSIFPLSGPEYLALPSDTLPTCLVCEQ